MIVGHGVRFDFAFLFYGLEKMFASLVGGRLSGDSIGEGVVLSAETLWKLVETNPVGACEEDHLITSLGRDGFENFR